MSINKILETMGMTKYRLSKLSGVPNSTLNDICSGKSKIEKCSAETIYKLAKALDVTVEELIKDSIKESEIMNNKVDVPKSFETYKSNVCHSVKFKGDLSFIYDTLKSDEIRILFEQKHYPQALYLLAMVDYLSRVNDLPICTNYNDIRALKFEKPIYPSGIILLAHVNDDESIKTESYENAIPEFKRFNIVENEVRNVI